MATEWPVVCLEEIASTDCKGFAMGPFGSNIRSENYQPSGIPILRGVNLGSDGSIDGELVYLSKAKAEELKNSQAFPGDLVFVAQGTVGKVGLVPDKPRFEKTILSQNLMKFSCDRSKCDPRFLYYYFISADGQHTISSRVNPTGVPCISQPLTSLKTFEVPLPPIAEQKAIASILGTLDNKIELNRRMNATLEAMARALFQSWFVDFDPVRAKLDGRQPTGLDPVTAALFPNEFEDSVVGHIPTGWRVMKIGEFINRLPVGPKYEQRTVLPLGRVPVLDQGKSGIIGYHNNEPGVTATPDQPVAVFANHTCYMRLITYPFSAIQNVLPFVGSGTNTFWAYYATEGRLAFSEYKGHWPDFVIQETAVPPRTLTDAFGLFVKPLVARIYQNEEESRTLAALRDSLLPKLLSGLVKIYL